MFRLAMAIVIGCGVLALAVIGGQAADQPQPGAGVTPVTNPLYQPGPVPPFISLEEVRRGWARAEERMLPPRVEVRGIYVTSYNAAQEARLNQILDLLDRTELNALVINIKDDSGHITFTWDHPLAKSVGAIRPDLGALQEFTAKLRGRGVYLIARVVTFKDGLIPPNRPEWAIAHSGGGIWRDYNGVPWLNPYNQEAWQYVVDVARAAAIGGFHEIQFDYVRFPTDGNLDAVVYPGRDQRSRERVIADFLAFARKELRPYRAWVSADVFGLVTSTADDMGIGQRLEEASAAVDYLSPMIYPSHYEAGNLGVANPNAMPYQTVYRSLLDAKERWAQANLTGQVIMRPWLQDFSLGHPYGTAEVRAQLQATYDAGYKEWLLWNAANVYTEAALAPAIRP